MAIISSDSNLSVFRLRFYDVSDKRLNLSIKEKRRIDFQAVALFRQQVATEADLSSYHKLRRDSPACSHILVSLCTNARLTRCFVSLHV